MPDEIQKIGCVFPVVDGECRVQPDARSVDTKKPRSNRMKRARPANVVSCAQLIRTKRRLHNTPDTSRHFTRRAASERQQQDTTRVRSVDDQVCDAARQGRRLSGAGARNNQQRAAP